MLFRELIVYLLSSCAAVTGLPCLRGASAALINHITQPDSKPYEANRKAASASLNCDDDGDAFTGFDFYYDERSWEEEGSDRV